MKNVSTEYESKETASERKPVELYHFWIGSTHYRYTSGDQEIVYGEEPPYSPAPISRGSSSFDAVLEVSRMDINIGRLTEPAIQYIATNPVALVWVSIMRVFLDQDPYEASVIFLGQVKSVRFKGVAAVAECVGFEFFLRCPIPKDRYQPQCNATLFDARCGKSTTGFTVTTVVAVDASGLTLTSSDFGSFEDNFFRYGYVEFGNEKRMVAEHVGNVLTLRYRVPSLETGDTVTAYAGCDGYVETCRDKFDNVSNFRGHPYIPVDNPVTWIG